MKRLDEFAANGGHLVLTCRSGLMDRNGQLWEGPLAAPLVPMIGANITGYDGLPDDLLGKVKFEGKTYRWNIWGDLLKPQKGTTVWAKYADQFYSGTPAVTRRSHGRGSVVYCGVFAEDGLADALLAKVVKEAKIKITRLPNRVQVLRRGAYRIALNYTDSTVTAAAPKKAKFVVGKRRIEPAGVAVWTE